MMWYQYLYTELQKQKITACDLPVQYDTKGTWLYTERTCFMC